MKAIITYENGSATIRPEDSNYVIVPNDDTYKWQDGDMWYNSFEHVFEELGEADAVEPGDIIARRKAPKEPERVRVEVTTSEFGHKVCVNPNNKCNLDLGLLPHIVGRRWAFDGFEWPESVNDLNANILGQSWMKIKGTVVYPVAAWFKKVEGGAE